MSVITLQLGQCGNQIGQLFYDTLTSDIQQKSTEVNSKEYCQCSLDQFFYKTEGEEVEARAISVDTEKKVVTNVFNQAKKTGQWRYPSNQQLSGKRGAGNNWADGFHNHGAKCEHEVLDLIQRELEKCDHFGGFCSLMSIGGGTGSGLGTRITKLLKENFAKSFLVNYLVWPHSAGEVIVQNYNAVLSMAHLSETSDALVIFQNDDLRKIAQTLTASHKVTFKDMNKVVSEQIVASLQPATSASGSSNLIGCYLEHLVPHPDYKLLTSRFVPQVSEAAVPFSTFNWPALVKRTFQMVLTQSVLEEGINWHIKLSNKRNKTLSNLLVNRGKGSPSVETALFSSPDVYPAWVPAGAGFLSYSQSIPLLGYEKSASVLSNCQTSVNALDNMVSKAWGMFAMRAYTHWYTRYGMQEEEFIDCFAKLEQIIKNYKSL